MSVESVSVDCLFSNQVVRIYAQPKARIADVIRAAELPLGFSCGGRAACVACIVYVEGTLTSVSKRESELLLGVDAHTDSGVPRIACLARILGPVKLRATYW